MADYFSLAHLGTGTAEVEGLNSYTTRLAQAHGCSEWQLTKHIRVWVGEEALTGLYRPISNNSSHHL